MMVTSNTKGTIGMRVLCFIGLLWTAFGAHAQRQHGQEEVQLLKDTKFRNGFLFLKPQPGIRIPGNISQTFSEADSPIWEVPQWGSHFDLGEGTRSATAAAVRFSDSAKTLTVYVDGRFSMRINGAVEYGDRPRQFFESWPHLYLTQHFSPNTFVNSFATMPFHLEGKHLFTRNYLGNRMDERLHTAQLIIQFFIQNKNEASPGYNNEKIILSLPVYDYRWDYRKETAFLDAGTKKTVTNTFVYGPGGKALWSGSFKDDTTNWHTMSCDLLPYIWEAFRAGKKAGYLPSSQFEDLALVSFVFGWEMPGTFDSEMIFRNLTLSGVPKPKVAARPNIALIIADDLGWGDLGCFGNNDVQTPNIDRLAESGIRFTNAYVTTSSCSPSRISLLTSRYPHCTGAAELHTEAPETLVFFPELLRNAGYFTGLSGKFHEGRHTQRAYDTLFVNRQANGPGGEATWTELLNTRDKTKPFFFWLSSYDPHRDWQLEDGERIHDPNTLEMPPFLLDDSVSRMDLASYYDEIARFDKYVGKFIEQLKAADLYDNTVIVLMSDNGRAFLGAKGFLTDQGVRTPLIISWPAGIKAAGEKSDALISSIDIAPLLCQLAGVGVPRSFQGVSFLYLLGNTTAPFRNFVFAEQNWHDFEGYQRMVRNDRFMYILNNRPEKPLRGPLDAVTSPSYNQLQTKAGRSILHPFAERIFSPADPEALYRIDSDPLQYINQIDNADYADELDTLRGVLARWREMTGDTMPSKLTPDWYDVVDGTKLPTHGIRGEMPGTLRPAVDQTGVTLF